MPVLVLQKIRCAGYTDIVLVVDASASVGNIHDAQSAYINEVAQRLHDDFNEPQQSTWGSPVSTSYQSRMGLVTFFGPSITGTNTCPDPYQNAELIFGMRSPGPSSYELSTIQSAVGSRRGASGLTCTPYARRQPVAALARKRALLCLSPLNKHGATAPLACTPRCTPSHPCHVCICHTASSPHMYMCSLRVLPGCNRHLLRTRVCHESHDRIPQSGTTHCYPPLGWEADHV